MGSRADSYSAFVHDPELTGQGALLQCVEQAREHAYDRTSVLALQPQDDQSGEIARGIGADVSEPDIERNQHATFAFQDVGESGIRGPL